MLSLYRPVLAVSYWGLLAGRRGFGAGTNTRCFDALQNMVAVLECLSQLAKPLPLHLKSRIAGAYCLWSISQQFSTFV